MSYADFISRKRRIWTGIGHEAGRLPDGLFDWQQALTRWALRKGRAALFCDTGLGKTRMQVAWASGLQARTLIFAPLCVAEQTVAEAAVIGVPVTYARQHSEAGPGISITNYERLDRFDMSQFDAVVLDESSILKAFDGKTRTRLIETCGVVKYRLCCTATPSPNDISELGNHAAFLGLMTFSEFLATWFVHDDNGWRMKKHAVQPFYRWMASWAVAMRKPSDLGYDDNGYVLPPLTIIDHEIAVDGPTGDTLFPEMSTRGLKGRLSARKGSLEARTDEAVRLVNQSPTQCQWLVWCGLNAESDRITDLVNGTKQNVQGSDDYDEKVAGITGFMRGDIRTLVSKTDILGYGLNLQHCHHMAFCGISDSFESFYQAVRRCWRFGQQHGVSAHVIYSEAEKVVVENVRRKELAARDLATELIGQMSEFEREEVLA